MREHLCNCYVLVVLTLNLVVKAAVSRSVSALSPHAMNMRVFVATLAVALAAQCARAEYQLNFLSSIQLGGFDTDAAENVGV